MKRCEEQARKLYEYDPTFHYLVDALTKVMNDTNIDPNIVHDAVNLAADKRSRERIDYKCQKKNALNVEE